MFLAKEHNSQIMPSLAHSKACVDCLSGPPSLNDLIKTDERFITNGSKVNSSDRSWFNNPLAIGIIKTK